MSRAMAAVAMTVALSFWRMVALRNRCMVVPDYLLVIAAGPELE